MSRSRLIGHIPVLAFWGGLMGLLITLEWSVRPGGLSPAVWAKPSESVRGLIDLFSTGGFRTDVAHTLNRTLVSLLIGYPVGLAMAVCIYCLGRARTSAEFLLDFVRSIPVTSLIPLLLVVAGIEGSKLVGGVLAAALVTAITMWVGIRDGVEQHGRSLMYYFRPSLIKQLRFIVLPNAVPAAIAGLRLSVSAVIVIIIVSEMFIGTTYGIGKVINDSQYTAFRGTQWGAVLFAGILGYALNRLAEWLPRALIWCFDQFRTPTTPHSHADTHPAAPLPITTHTSNSALPVGVVR